MGLTAQQLQALESHIGRKASAYKSHKTHLDQDANARLQGAPHPPHSASRHGYQTGWQSQILRACTQLSPDQASKPDGVKPEITEWNREIGTWAYVRSVICSYSPIKLPYIDPPTVKTYNASGQPTTRTIKEQETNPVDPAPDGVEPGQDAGGFISPEAQQEALKRANSIAFKLWKWEEAEFATGGGTLRPFSRIGMVIGGRPGGYGLGFLRKADFGDANWQRSSVERAIQAYEERWTWQQWEGDLDVSQMALANTVRFPTMQDLCDYLRLTPDWQKNALVILDKTASHGKWTLVTAYPVNLELGWAPSGPAGNARHKSTGPVWRGRVRCNKNGAFEVGNYPVPPR
jgi:hypothetical protein